MASPRVTIRALVAALLLVLAGGFSLPLAAQTLSVGDSLEEYLRVLQVAGRVTAGSFNVRPFVTFAGIPDSVAHPWRAHLAPRHASGARGPQLSLDAAKFRVTVNSGYPSGANDGAMWQGKGMAFALDAGATLAWGPLTATLHPVVWHAQNQSFELGPVSTPGAPSYSYPWRIIDLPQRMGPGPTTRVDPGQSTVRLTLGGATAGLGSESLWWGPGIHNAILMSDNAAGFPHGFLATSRPVDVRIGSLEAQWIWGRLQESGWFDSTSVAESRRFITGAVVSLTPKGLDGLSLGMARVFYQLVPKEGLDAHDYYLVFRSVAMEDFQSAENPSGSDERDQIASFFARWVSAASGFEAYAEWARNDHGVNLRDYVLEPEHSQAYTLGFQKMLPLSRDRMVAIGGELTHLEQDPTFRVRNSGPYYAHYIPLAGYTQRGQVIGSGLGPGGNGQYLSADLYTPGGRVGGFLFREVHDNDAYYVRAPEVIGLCCHDVTLGGGGRFTAFLGAMELSASARLDRELNRYFVHRNDVWNANLSLSATWRPSGAALP